MLLLLQESTSSQPQVSLKVLWRASYELRSSIGTKILSSGSDVAMLLVGTSVIDPFTGAPLQIDSLIGCPQDSFVTSGHYKTVETLSHCGGFIIDTPFGVVVPRKDPLDPTLV